MNLPGIGQKFSWNNINNKLVIPIPKLQKMEIMDTILATLLAFLLVLGYARAEDCETCLPTHPQDQFCTADYGMYIFMYYLIIYYCF